LTNPQPASETIKIQTVEKYSISRSDHFHLVEIRNRAQSGQKLIKLISKNPIRSIAGPQWSDRENPLLPQMVVSCGLARGVAFGVRIAVRLVFMVVGI